MSERPVPLDAIDHPDAQGHGHPDPVHHPGHEPHDLDDVHARKKRDKLRAAWIAFVGRILAQLIGAAATIVLGLYVVRTYGVGTSRDPAPRPPENPAPAAPVAPHDHRSIAVLPLVSFSPEPGDEALCAGLTEAIIARLAQDRAMRVVSRTSSMLYRGSDKTLPAIAAELGVDLVLEGSVTRVGTRLRVTTQLVDASTDTHLWAATFDRTTADLLALEAELPATIAQGVRAAVEAAPR